MSADWLQQPERGSRLGYDVIVWFALRLGRPLTRILLYPICLYFMVLPRNTSKALRRYLGRVLSRRVGLRDLFKHYHYFSSTVLDRVYILTKQYEKFDLNIYGSEEFFDRVARNQGCLLLGSHLGSFDVVRASRVKFLNRFQDLPIKMLMHENNSPMILEVFNSLDPELAKAVIHPGQADAMLRVKKCLDRGELVGILGDRAIKQDKLVVCRFLGKEVNMPAGPMLLAHLVKAPVILFFGLYRGGNRYDIHFELFTEKVDINRETRDSEVQKWVQRYVDRLEYYCRKAPYNWFNFYDYWGENP